MEFNNLKLEDLATFKYGKMPNSKKKSIGGPYPIYTGYKISGYYPEYMYEDEMLIIVARGVGGTGDVKIAPPKCYITNLAIILELDKANCDYKYMQLYLQSLNLRYLDSGSAQSQITINDLKRLKVSIPDLTSQQKIAKRISNIEEKITNNNNIIHTLEQLSQTIFKQWFIDFEFPNEEGLPYKSSGGEMVESELGEIPKGWNLKYLSENVDFLSGGTPKTKEETYWNGTIPFFTPKDAKNSLYTTTTEKSITDLGLEKCNSKLYPKNTLFITARGTVGKLALANRPMAMNQSCFALKHKEGKQFYLYNVVENLVKEIILGANGAVFNAINLNDLKRLKYAYSNERLIINFENKVSRFYEKMSLLEEENINLQQLRDTLLPKLLSGEIEIPDDLEV